MKEIVVDSAKGTEDSFSNLYDALKYAATVNEEKTVKVKAGRYFFDRTLEIGKELSNINIVAEGDVFFDGGKVISPPDVKPYKDGIYVIDLEKYKIEPGEYGNRGFRRPYVNAPTELFINSKAQSVARYPKTGAIPFVEGDIVDSGSNIRHGEYDNRPATVKIRDNHFDKWTEAKDAYIAGYPKNAYADDCIKINSFDKENRTVKTEEPTLYSFVATGHSSYYIVNLMEELTEQGEYFVDRREKKLYFIPKENVDIKNALIQVSVLDEVMVAIEDAKNVLFRGITFENTRNSAVYIEGGEGVHFDLCTFRNLGILAVQIGRGASPLEHSQNDCHGGHSPKAKPMHEISREMGSWHEYVYEFAAWDNNGGKNHLIENCKIYDTGAGGILLSGGNRKRLIPANNKVYNTEFYSVNRLDKTYKAAVNIMGVGNVISHCYMHDLPSMAIYLHGNDHIIEYNEITTACTEVSDAGAFYMGRDMSEVGNVIRNNYFHDIKNTVKSGLGVAALYFDDWDIFNCAYDNFFVRIEGGGFCVVHHTCGGLFSFNNNFVIDCLPGVNFNNKSNSYLYMHEDALANVRLCTEDEGDIRGVNIKSEVYKKKYPYLFDVYENNSILPWMYYYNEFCYKNYKMFVDGEHGDFTQKEGYRAPGTGDGKGYFYRTDPIMGYKNEIVYPHKVDFKTIGLIKEK